ncbi:DUF1156 domain-containing protein [Stratiformator vulcanicus]|uniref:DUF1156 domain-containing protein n=1 Tax=Stratiformator vulcanicus TaxID=2527980 RepID=A0A517QWK8_9PLAN|nr:DUF1156 domain-containing protein [Stratiformator vulcanicus]QDT36021.1 hypothetical protein Pan189_03760 [Stratiformator vulcanicus]
MISAIKYPKRLIEVDLPIARISAHARREKSIRHGHISTLHIWWARRPLAACRAVICASLWPDPADELCPPAFREAAATQLMAFAHRMFPAGINEEGHQLNKTSSPESRGRWEGLIQSEKNGLPLDSNDPAHQQVLRGALLDFIADFANWDNSTVPAYLETSRALTQAAHEALGGVPGTRPLVVDPFAGGGSIPLEALRVGADAFASDLNPVAVLLNKVVLEYIPKYGQKLADEVRKWGQWVKAEAEKELAEFYPKDPDGATPIAYLWARTILSEAPGQVDEPVEVPLIRSMWLCKKANRKVAMRFATNKQGNVITDVVNVDTSDGKHLIVRRPRLEIFEPSKASEVRDGIVARGSATCPVTGFTTPLNSVKQQLKSRFGGGDDARLLCVVVKREGTTGRQYRMPDSHDIDAIDKAKKYLELQIEPEEVPTESTTNYHSFVNRGPIYGMTKWRHYFTPRQSVALALLARSIRRVGETSTELKSDVTLASAVASCLTLAFGKQADLTNSLCAWEPIAQCPRHLFGKQAIGMVWDFAEGIPIGDSSGAWSIQVSRTDHVLESIGHDWAAGTVQLASAVSHPLPSDSVNALVTDPPYYYSVQYADLADFFYVWFKRILSASHPDLFKTPLIDKDDEIIVQSPGHEFATEGKNNAFYEEMMTRAMSDSRRIVQPAGIGVVVFAHTSTAGWESQLQAMVEAGWTITGSWPIDTEMASRVIAQGRSVLASSVHLIIRPREDQDGTLRNETGEWRDVLSELPKRIHEWMPRLAAEGVVGADAIFACLGPALEIFSRYSRVEKASGEAVPLREYLEQVWATVSTEALSMIFKDADAAGLEPDARLTAMWLWTLGGGTGKAAGESATIVPGLADEDTDGDPVPAEKTVASTGYSLEFDAARKIAQGLGIHLEKNESIVEVKGDKARLLPVSERTRHLFGKDEATATTRGRKKAKAKQLDLFKTLDEIESEAEETIAGELKPQAGETVLDRVHQSMILFASGRGEALKRFLVDDGAGNEARFWKLAQSLSALYPKETDEKRWVDGVLARKKGLGL